MSMFIGMNYYMTDLFLYSTAYTLRIMTIAMHASLLSLYDEYRETSIQLAGQKRPNSN